MGERRYAIIWPSLSHGNSNDMKAAVSQMKLGAFLMAGGHHIAGWRHPDAHAHAGVDVEHFIALAQMAERAQFDMVFFEDAAAIRERDPRLPSRSIHRLRATQPVGCTRRQHLTDRPGRHRIHDLQRALWAGANIRLARSIERWTGWLESG